MIEGGTTRFTVEQPRYDPQAYALFEGAIGAATLRYRTQRMDDHFVVDIQGASGTMVRLYSRGASGRKGKELFRTLPRNTQWRVPTYPVQDEPVTLVVESRLGEVVNSQ